MKKPEVENLMILCLEIHPWEKSLLKSLKYIRKARGVVGWELKRSCPIIANWFFIKLSKGSQSSLEKRTSPLLYFQSLKQRRSINSCKKNHWIINQSEFKLLCFSWTWAQRPPYENSHRLSEAATSAAYMSIILLFFPEISKWFEILILFLFQMNFL